MTHFNDVTDSLRKLRETHGHGLADHIVELFGEKYTSMLAPKFYEAVKLIADRACGTDSHRHAANVILDAYREHGVAVSERLTALAAHVVPPRPRLPSPNEVIAALLQIAAAAEGAAALSMNAPDPTQVLMPMTAYQKLCDELAALEPLPHEGVNASGSMRAAEYLKTFTTGLELGKDIKQVMLTHVQDSVAAMADYIKAHGVPRLASGPLADDAAQDSMSIDSGTIKLLAEAIGYTGASEYPNLGMALIEFVSGALKSDQGTLDEAAQDADDTNKILADNYLKQQASGLHESFRAEQFDKIVHAYHQVFDPAPTMSVEDITANVIEFVMNSSKMDIPHGHPVTIGAPCAIYEVAYVDNLLNAVADVALDGKRFHTMMWLFDCEQKIGDSVVEGERHLPQWASYTKANEIMENMQPETAQELADSLDAVRRAGLVPSSNDKIDSAANAERLRMNAFNLAKGVVSGYRVAQSSGQAICSHCGATMPGHRDDTLNENHGSDCLVLQARQLIEDQS